MTREEEILRTAGDYHKSPTICAAFVDGAEWADRHPCFWRNISVMPRFWTHVVLRSDNGVFMVHTVCTKNYEKWITMCKIGNFTHWMPIPKLPKEQED